MIRSDKKFPGLHWGGSPDERLREACIDLLDLEVSRAQHNLFTDPPVHEASKGYKADIARSARVLRIVRRRSRTRCETPALAFLWLTLLGHRLAAERGLPVEGFEALAYIAALALNLPLTETETWSDETFFRHFTETALREEWDYPGLQFRMPAQV